jgi:type II secretory pathway pseudopilin PulG
VPKHSNADDPVIHDEAARQIPPGDGGATLIELIIAIVIIGMTVTATLVALQTTILATTLDRDHSNAHAWLQTAADVLYAEKFVACDDVDGAGLGPTAAYDAFVKTTNNPEGWPPANIEVVGPVMFWNYTVDSSTGLQSEYWSATDCDIDSDLQLVTIRVRDPNDARIIEEVQVVIDE